MINCAERFGVHRGAGRSERDRLAALGTFVEIEELTAEIGDEVSRQLAQFNCRSGRRKWLRRACMPVPNAGGRRRLSFFPLAGELKRPVRETVTPQVMEKAVWDGRHQGSFGAAAVSMKMLAENTLSAKQVRRIVVSARLPSTTWHPLSHELTSHDRSARQAAGT